MPRIHSDLHSQGELRLPAAAAGKEEEDETTTQAKAGETDTGLAAAAE